MKTVARNLGRKIENRVGIFLVIVSVLGIIALTVEQQRERSELIETSLGDYFDHLIVIGDIFEITRYFNSIIENEHLNAVFLVRDHKKIVTYAKGAFLFDTLEQWPSHTWMTFQSFPPLIVQPIALKTPGYTIQIISDIPYKLLLISTCIVAMIAYLFLRQSQQGLNELSVTLTYPLEQLVDKLGSLEEIDSSKIDAKSDIVEVQKLTESFRELLRRLAQSEQERQNHKLLVAVGKTAQLLAHDLRHPFERSEMLLKQLSQAEHDSVDSLVAELGNIVEHFTLAHRDVRDMLSEVLEVGAPNNYPLINAEIMPIIRDAMHEAEARFPDKEFITSVQINKNAEHASLHPAKIKRVLMNLLSNAMSATKSGGEISVRGTSNKNEISLIFFNAGRPIPDSDIPLLFQPFFTKRKSDGTGLGLAIVQKILHGHGGSIRYEKAHNGNKFVVTLRRTVGKHL